MCALASAPLIERETYLERLDALLDGAQSGNGGCVLVEGPPGVGKTSLLAAVVRSAEARGLRSLRASGGELERDFAYGVVRQLFERHVRSLPTEEVDQLLGGAARLAAPALGVDQPGLPATGLDAPFAAVHGLYWLTIGLAADQPLLLAIDDLHWADAPSVRWVTYLARRLEGVPALLVAVIRDGETATTEAIDALRREPLIELIHPSLLSAEGVTQIVRSRVPEADSTFCRACHGATGGNPFYLHELLTAARADRVPPTRKGAAALASLGPAGVGSAVLARLRREGESAEKLARAVAVLDADASLRRVAELADISQDQAAAAVDQLVGAQILSRGRAFEFIHPVVRAAVYNAIAPAERLRLHGAAFLLLVDRRVPAERLARHLLLVEPAANPAILQTLREAAAAAQPRGAPDLAARYLQRALDETQTQSEEAAVMHDLGLAQLADRNPAAFEHLGRAIDLTDDRPQREAWSLELTRALATAGRPGEASEFARHALARGISDRALEVRLQSELLSMAWLMPSDSAEGIRLLEQLERADIPAELAHLVLLHRALRITAEAGPAEEAISLSEAAIEGGALLEQQSSLPFVVLITLVWNDDLERPRQLCNAALAFAQQIGSQHLTVNAGAFGALAAVRAGLLAEAAGTAGLSYEFARESAMPGSVDWAWALAILMDSLRERGDIAAAQELLHEAEAEQELPGHVTFVFLLESRGRLRCAQGRLREGVADLLEAGRRWEPFGLLNPNVSAWRSDAAMALLQLGETEQAQALVDRELELARAAGTQRGIGVALRVSGLVHHDELLLSEAVEVLAGSPARLEYAKAMCELGAARRRAGKRAGAQDVLLRALDLARRCTASPLVERSRAELAVIGSRPRRDYIGGVESLTPGELRVARMAADGRPNKEIAQALFLTLRTVETHLTHVYRKLDIESRVALTGALTDSEVAA
jgi:DNA-binding CsgD family transcriptional regulator